MYCKMGGGQYDAKLKDEHFSQLLAKATKHKSGEFTKEQVSVVMKLADRYGVEIDSK